MKPFLTLIALLISADSFSSYSTELAKGQDAIFGSFYLSSDRTKFRNSSKLLETKDSLSIESEGEISYKNDDYAIALGRKLKAYSVIDGFYQLNDFSGLSGFFSLKNSQGMGAWGFTYGIDMEYLGLYVGGQKLKDEHFLPKVGLSLKCYDGTLFSEYQGEIFSVPQYNFTLGFGKEFGKFFGDITYFQDSEDLKSLTLTAGGKVLMFESLYAIASGKKELFFTHSGKIMVGLEYHPTSKIELDLTHSLTAFSKAKPTYQDFDLTLSAAYYF
jgi:hypothetical protein